MKEDARLNLSEHLGELRGRVIKSAIAVLISSVVVYNFVDNILALLAKPVGRLVFIAPTEAFVTNIKISLFGGLFLASPVIVYQIWRFVSAGLRPHERRYALIFGPVSFAFFTAGASFGYLVIIPIGIKFLLGFATDFVSPMITISKYVSFVSTLVFAFGMIFQMPLVSLFLTKIGLVTPAFLLAKRRHAVVFMFIAAATLTPPDVITQCLMAVPLLILYEVGILFSRLAYKQSIEA